MRIYLKLNKSKETIPFNYQSYVTGAIHKWIGKENEIHDKASLYSFSWFQNVDTSSNGVRTKSGSYLFISAFDEILIKRIITGIREDATICFGSYAVEIQIVNDPEFSNREIFYTGSPIFIKRRFENNEKHISYNDPNAGTYLTETLQKKLKIANLSVDGVRVSFDKNYPSARTKIISYKTIGNKVNICPVIIEGTPEQIAFAWNVGVGNSTGIGFGALK